MIRQFIESSRAAESPVGRMDARVKLVLAVGWVVCIVLTPIAQWHRLALYGVLLCAMYFVARVPIRWLLCRLAFLLPFLALVVVSLPFVPRDDAVRVYPVPHTHLTVSDAGLRALASVGSKALLSVLVMTLLAATTPLERTLTALQTLRVPTVFVTLISFMYRYLFVLVDEAQRMVRARDARGRPSSLRRRVGVAGSMVGALFVRSYERSERVATAMIARGFDGTMRTLVEARCEPWHIVAGVLFGGLLTCVALLPG
ncbi:MAG: cobalt ECF transporter T component CbiQ [Armatimonadota bacterium]